MYLGVKNKRGRCKQQGQGTGELWGELGAQGAGGGGEQGHGGGGRGSASWKGGTENHRDPFKSLHQGNDVVPLHFRKVTTANCGDWWAKSGRDREPGQKDGLMPGDVGAACKVVEVKGRRNPVVSWRADWFSGTWGAGY